MRNIPIDEQSVGQQKSPVEPENVPGKDSGSEVPGEYNMGSGAKKPGPGFITRALKSFWQGLELRRIFMKALTLIYALAVFGYAYFHMAAHRNILSYMGVMLLMVIVYAEILVIRDHLWVIEGSMRESRRWRDVFFNQTSLRRQRVRKFLSILFSMGIFSYMYFKSGPQHKAILSYMGVMLMMTVLYYEILTIRDEIFLMGQSIIPCSDDESEKRKQHYAKFIEQPHADAESEPQSQSSRPEHKV
ncbi:MAG: hypothetical protein KKB51_16205 [Candidatus Riflebacteria bacterium]|nr:hypothetical protein [Candidatus Riflebacteria bacterium]